MSPLHRVKSDEQFSHIDGDSLTVHIFNEKDKTYSCQMIGKEDSSNPHLIIPQGSWFSYNVEKKGRYILLSCILSPGFNPADFELAAIEDKERLLMMFPGQGSILESCIVDNSMCNARE